MTALKFNKVNTLPTSGYNEGDVYFVKSEKKIYVRTATGWEDYSGDGSGGGVASKLLNPRLDGSSSPVISVGNASGDDQTFSVVHSEDFDNNQNRYGGAKIKLRQRDLDGGEYVYCETDICGTDIKLSTFDGFDDVVHTEIGQGYILLNNKSVITESNINSYLPNYINVLSSNSAETCVPSKYTGTVILTNTSGKKTIKLPASDRYNGRTITILRIATSNGQIPQFELTTQDGKAMQKVTGTTTVYTMNLSSSGKYTCIYSSSANRWYIMRDDFVSL